MEQYLQTITYKLESIAVKVKVYTSSPSLCSKHSISLPRADCMPNRYGYRCKRVCDCENGDCDPVKGCVCDAGYTGNHCESGIYK